MTATALLRQLAALPAGTTFTRDAVVELLGQLEGTRDTPNAGDLLDGAEAARRLGVSRDWLTRHRLSLPFVRKLSHRVVRYSAAGIAAYVARGGK